MINIGLDDSNRRKVTRVLNNLLSDEYLLSTKTKNYRWNVTGPHSHDLHALFGYQYARLDVLIDQVGKRVHALGGNAFGTMTEFLRCTPPGASGSASERAGDGRRSIRRP
jgi:starvation-inducible DNA-binding protein